MELRRRGVFKAVAAYAVVAWGASLAAIELLPTFGAPEWAARAFIVCAVLGVPIAAAAAWIYELTARGVVREPEMPVAATLAETTRAFGAVPTLRVRWTDGAGSHERDFLDSFTIGRDAHCELRFDDSCVSRRHAEVRLERGRWWVVDLGSRNGTRLDACFVSRAPLLRAATLRLYDAGPELRLDPGGASPTMTIAAGGVGIGPDARAARQGVDEGA
jgi:hypothetical protein